MLVSSTIGSTLSIPDLNERETETDRQTEHMEFIMLLI